MPRPSPLKADVLIQLKPRNIGIPNADGLPENLTAGAHYDFCCLAVPEHKIWRTKLFEVLRGSDCPTCMSLKASPLKVDVIAILTNHNIGLPNAEILPDRLQVSVRYDFCCLAFPRHQMWRTKLTELLSGGTGCPECACLASPLKMEVLDQLAKRNIGMPDADSLPKKLRTKERYTFCCLAVPQHRTWKTRLASVRYGSGCPECAPHTKQLEKPQMDPSSAINLLGILRTCAHYVSSRSTTPPKHNLWRAKLRNTPYRNNSRRHKYTSPKSGKIL